MGEEREESTKQAPQDTVRCKDAGGIDCVSVDEEGHHTHEHKHETESEGGSEHDANDPVDLGIVRPCEDEETDGKADTADHTWGQTGFWRCTRGSFTPGDFFGAMTALVARYRIDDGSEHSDEDGQER